MGREHSQPERTWKARCQTRGRRAVRAASDKRACALCWRRRKAGPTALLVGENTCQEALDEVRMRRATQRRFTEVKFMQTVGLKPHPGADFQRGTFILFIIGVALSFISAGTAAAPAPRTASSGDVIPTYSLSVTTPGGGNVLVNPSNPSYASNVMVSISASAKSGW